MLQHPGPCEVACAGVRAVFPARISIKLVEQSDRPDDEPAELCAVEHGTRACVDAERPGRVRRVSGAYMTCERIRRSRPLHEDSDDRRSTRRRGGNRGRASRPCPSRCRRRNAAADRPDSGRNCARPRRRSGTEPVTRTNRPATFRASADSPASPAPPAPHGGHPSRGTTTRASRRTSH